MSKICSRKYTPNSMYTVKVIDGIGYCPICDQPAICHGKSVVQRALFWMVSSDRGLSSESIVKHMLGIYRGERLAPPSDSNDRRRCIRLLELIPEWIPKLKEMVKYDAPDKRQEGFVVSSSGITSYDNSWSKQIPLILEEGKL